MSGWGNQPEIKEILQKKKDKQVKVTPMTSKSSTKKQTPPSSERPNSKKHHHTVVVMEPEPTSTDTIKKSQGDRDERFNARLKGFSEEFIEFGKTMIEFLQPMCDDIKSLVESNRATLLTLLDS